MRSVVTGIDLEKERLVARSKAVDKSYLFTLRVTFFRVNLIGMIGERKLLMNNGSRKSDRSMES